MKKLLVLGGVALMVTSSLVMAAGENKNKHNFTNFDANADGVISKQEATGRMAKYFDKIDLDGDDSITKAEFDTMRENKKGRHHKAGKFANLDVNNDGFITKDEAKNRLLKHFDNIDADKDGKISEQELKDARAQHKGNKRHQRPAFETLDTNGDDMISKEEFEAHQQQRSDMKRHNKHNK